MFQDSSPYYIPSFSPPYDVKKESPMTELTRIPVCGTEYTGRFKGRQIFLDNRVQLMNYSWSTVNRAPGIGIVG
jgi:hypothetical protein